MFLFEGICYSTFCAEKSNNRPTPCFQYEPEADVLGPREKSMTTFTLSEVSEVWLSSHLL